MDTDDDGVREMPDGSRDLTLRYAERSESELRAGAARVHHRLARRHRHRHRGVGLRRQPADDVDRVRRVRPVHVGLDAVRRPRPDALLLHVRPAEHRRRQLVQQRRQLVLRGVRRDVRGAERRARPGTAAGDRPRDAACSSTPRAPTSCCPRTPTCRRTAPTASRAGCASPPTLVRCCSRTPRPATSTSRSTGDGSSGGSNTALWIAVAAGAVALLAIGGVFAVRRRATREERE